MADIFISYSKADRIDVVKLASFLESQGYSVWWDQALRSGDEFRDVIVGELAKARAVIVLWSPNSIGSDWVRSEAGRAHADRKLIPVRSPEIDYKQIPPPFDVLHTEPLGNVENIHAAVTGQLAKPDTPGPDTEASCGGDQVSRLELVRNLWSCHHSIHRIEGDHRTGRLDEMAY
jgi:hypothetical protein